MVEARHGVGGDRREAVTASVAMVSILWDDA
jgi:hypothetical protein